MAPPKKTEHTKQPPNKSKVSHFFSLSRKDYHPQNNPAQSANFPMTYGTMFTNPTSGGNPAWNNGNPTNIAPGANRAIQAAWTNPTMVGFTGNAPPGVLTALPPTNANFVAAQVQTNQLTVMGVQAFATNFVPWMGNAAFTGTPANQNQTIQSVIIISTGPNAAVIGSTQPINVTAQNLQQLLNPSQGSLGC